MTVMQKLLTPATAAAISDRGSAALGGPVARAVDVADMRPADLLEAHRWSGPGMPWSAPPPYVDVLRFESNALMHLTTPGPVGPRPWPTYELGFLHRGTAAVWMLARTRVPVDTEYWRIDADGRQRRLSVYGGAAAGWSGATAFRPPLGLTGPRASWRGAELPCILTRDGRGVELLSLSEAPPEGFETVRPDVHRRVAPLGECDKVFELDLTATCRGVAVRVLQVAGEQAQVQLLDPDHDSVQALAAIALEPGAYEAVVLRAELTDAAGTTRELPGVGAREAAAGVGDKAAAFLTGVAKLPAYVGLTMLGRFEHARFVDAGQTTTIRGPLTTTRLEPLALGWHARGLYAIWSRTGRSIAAFSAQRNEDEIVFLPGTSFTLVATRLIEGVEVHLVVESDPEGGAAPEAVLGDLVAAARVALETHGEIPPGARPDRFLGDIT